MAENEIGEPTPAEEPQDEAQAQAGPQESGALLRSLDMERLREIIRLCRENEIAELEIKHGKTRLHIKGRGADTRTEYVVQGAAPPPVATVFAPPSQAPPPGEEAARVEEAPEAAAVPAEAQEEDNIAVVCSPMVGTFYRAPAPDAPPYVDMGDVVKENTVLCIVEAMKLMNEIKAEARGTVAKILVENGQPVEYNQPMFHIRTE